MGQGSASRTALAHRGRRLLKRFALAVTLAALSLTASASPAGASITLGQLADPTMSNCSAGLDIVQTSVSAGSSYTVPASGTITSWSTIVVVPVGGRATLKVFRRTADPTSFQVVGHDGPETLSQLGTVTFPASIPVKPGDLLGIHPVDTVKCAFASPGSEVRYAVSNAQDGQAATLGMTGGNALLDIQATFVPDNSFSLGKPKLNKNGTATITAKVPNPGKLTGSGKGVKVAGAAVISKKVSAPGKVKLTIRATGKKKTTLNETGKVKVKAKITYTPTGGDSATQSKTVRLKKKL